MNELTAKSLTILELAHRLESHSDPSVVVLAKRVQELLNSIDEITSGPTID